MPPESNLSKPERKKLTASYRTVEVRVTQQHIDAAIPQDSGHCMIADALRDALPHAKGISVDLQTIRFTDPKKEQRYTYFTPVIAQDYLVAFDGGQPLEPFTFRLNQVVQVTRAGAGNKGVSSASEGMKKTRHNKVIGTKLGGEPLPLAALHTGVGTYTTATKEFLQNRENEGETRPASRVSEETQNEEETWTTSRVSEKVGNTETKRPRGWQARVAQGLPPDMNVTLSAKGGHRRRYGMRQLRTWNVARGPSA